MKNNFRFTKFKSGIITIQVQCRELEKFINILWRNGVVISKVKKNSVNTITFDTSLSNYERIKEIAAKTKSRIKIMNRKGTIFLVFKLKKRITMAIGLVIFVGVICYLSTFIWGIDIKTDKNIAPYDIREELKNIGIKPGISKNSVNVYAIEEKLMDCNDNIMWVRVRIQGAKLKIVAAERTSPPQVVNDNNPCNLVAKKDGQIVRVYTSAGTAVVKPGDIVRKGQVIVKGEQGKEGTSYQVHAAGDVIARTYTEEIKEIPLTEVKKIRTGNKVENYYLLINNKKIYFKKSINKFTKYDKMVEDDSFIKKEIYYEIKEKTIKSDPKKVEENTVNLLYSDIVSKFDKSVRIMDKIVENKIEGDLCKVRVVVVTEENIAEIERKE